MGDMGCRSPREVKLMGCDVSCAGSSVGLVADEVTWDDLGTSVIREAAMACPHHRHRHHPCLR